MPGVDDAQMIARAVKGIEQVVIVNPGQGVDCVMPCTRRVATALRAVDMSAVSGLVFFWPDLGIVGVHCSKIEFAVDWRVSSA